jgi:nitroreductase
MTLLEAIDARTSRRTYLGTPVDAERAAKLRALIDEANAASGLSIRFIDDGASAFGKLSKSYGMFRGVRSLVALVAKKNTPELFEKIGYQGERIVLEATRLGLGTCWVGGTLDRNNPALKIADDETLAAVITVGDVPADKTTKERLITRLTHRSAKPIEKFYVADVATPPAWFLAGVTAVMKAPSAMNRQSVRVTLKGEAVTLHTEIDDDAGKMDLGIAKAHFEIGREA